MRTDLRVCADDSVRFNFEDGEVIDVPANPALKALLSKLRKTVYASNVETGKQFQAQGGAIFTRLRMCGDGLLKANAQYILAMRPDTHEVVRFDPFTPVDLI